jgi:hypothetical protein
MGYNFLKSNGESAKVIAERIRGLVKGYKKRGFRCDEVIVCTHSMGGLVGRALLHPDYGNLLNDNDIKVLGMYHNVMPTMGAAATYKRMRFGFNDGWGPVAALKAQVIALDGKHATAILANTPAPLEMLPGALYGKEWLKVIDCSGKTLGCWPNGTSSALDSIYLQPNNMWWRLVNPLWVNPANLSIDDGGGLDKVNERIRKAAEFLGSIEGTFHPQNCFASYCSSTQHLSFGEVVFLADHDWNPFTEPAPLQGPLPPLESWKLLHDDAQGTLKIQAGKHVLVLRLQSPSAAGDETVPADRSAGQIKGTLFVHGRSHGRGYEHQASYSDHQVLMSMLYSLVQIAKTAKWS